MAKIEAVIREAILRGARKELRRASAPLRREVRRLRQAVRQLRKDAAAGQDTAARLARLEGDRPWRPTATEAQLKKARLSPRLIRKLRGRLALSQAALGRLVGVTAAAVVSWELGRSTPADQNRGALVGLRRLGRREVRRLLAAAPAPPSPKRSSKRARRRARASSRSRRGPRRRGARRARR